MTSPHPGSHLPFHTSKALTQVFLSLAVLSLQTASESEASSLGMHVSESGLHMPHCTECFIPDPHAPAQAVSQHDQLQPNQQFLYLQEVQEVQEVTMKVHATA